MYAAHRTRSERSFSLAVLASVLVVFALTTALLGGFVLWSSAEIDNVALDRQSQRVSHGLSRQQTTVPRDIVVNTLNTFRADLSMLRGSAFPSRISTRMFDGLRSRWMIPFWCAC